MKISGCIVGGARGGEDFVRTYGQPIFKALVPPRLRVTKKKVYSELERINIFSNTTLLRFYNF